MMNFRNLSLFCSILIFFSCSSITFIKSYPEKKPTWVEKSLCFEDETNYYCISGESKSNSLDACLEKSKTQSLKKIVVEKLVQIIKSNDYSKQEYEQRYSYDKAYQYELDKFETEFQQIRATTDFREINYQNYYEEWHEKNKKTWVCVSMITVPKSEIKRIRDNQLGVKHRYENGNYYEGEWKDGKRHGNGILTTDIFKMECVWENNKCSTGLILPQNNSFNKIVLQKNSVIKMIGKFGEITGIININIDSLYDKKEFNMPIMGEGEIDYRSDYNCINGNSITCNNYNGDFLCNYNYHDNEYLCHPTGKGILTYYDQESEKRFEGFIKDNSLFSGKLYIKGILKYDGKFKNNKLNGYGKSFSKNERLIYEGYWKDGQYNGIGKKYNENGKLLYEGEFKEGIPYGNGKGMLKYNNESQYVGLLKNGIPNGWGKLFDKNGHLRYEGNFLAGQLNGKGKFYYENGNILYDGTFKKGQPDGTGSEYSNDGIKIYIGSFKNGKRNGGKCFLKKDVLNLRLTDRWVDCYY